MIRGHTGMYMPPKKGAWLYTISGWNVIPIAEEIVSSMIEDGYYTRDQMEDVVQDYWEDAGWLIYSRDVDAAQGKLMSEVRKVVDEYIAGIEVEFEHIHGEGKHNKKNTVKAFQIASDHLYEFPDYYTALDAMEQKLKTKWKK